MKIPFNLRSFSLVLLSSMAMVTPGSAVTTYIGNNGGDGNLSTASNWDNGLPSASDAGIISVGNTDSITAALNSNFNATIIQTAGHIDYDGWQFNLFGTASVYDLQGGGLTVGRWIVNGATYNVSGGTVTGTDAATGTHSFANNGHLNLSGSGTVNLDELNYNNGGHQGYVDIAAGWTGSFTIGNIANGSTIEGAWEATDWEAMFAAGVGGNIHGTIDGAAINPADFYTIFQVTDDGHTLSLVPEPGSPILLGLGGLVLLRRRRNRG